MKKRELTEAVTEIAKRLGVPRSYAAKIISGQVMQIINSVPKDQRSPDFLKLAVQAARIK